MIISDQNTATRDGLTRVTDPAWRGHAVSMADAVVQRSEVLLDGPKRFVREKLVMPAGQVIDWAYVDAPASVMVVPVMADGQFVMVYQYRHNLRRHALEFPAGVIGGGEEPEKAAVRELAEETGFALAGDAELEPLGTFYSLPSETNKYTHVFLARPVTKQGPATRDTEVERWFNMSVQITPPGVAMREIGKSLAGTETITALMLARDVLGGQPARAVNADTGMDVVPSGSEHGVA